MQMKDEETPVGVINNSNDDSNHRNCNQSPSKLSQNSRLLNQRDMATQKELSGLLVGVVGDYLPANKVVCFQYLLRLLGGMLSHCQPSFLNTKHRPPTKEF